MIATKVEKFIAHGHEWTKHVPGDPMPCGRNEEVSVIWREELDADSMGECSCEAKNWEWSLLPHIPGKNIIGWRRADPPQKERTTDEQVREWMQRHDWPGSLSAARAAIEDAQSLHLA